MITTADDAAQFRDWCLTWQKRLGLYDWSLTFKTAPADGIAEAEADYDCETREVTLTYFIGVPDASHPRDTALHEMLHVGQADMLLAGVEATSEEDKYLVREEHKWIERLCKVIK